MDSAGKTRIGIIGVGIIGEHHLQEYAKDDRVEVVAACDINPERLALMADRYAIPHRYGNIGRLLDRDDLDAVDVCLHNHLHAPVSIEAMRRGRHVYCEKPMAGTYADALAMYEASRAYDRMLHIQLAFLYQPETRVAKRFVDAGELGRIYHLRSTGFRRRGRPYVDGYATKEFVNSEWSGGGALFDMAVYHISQLLFLVGNPVLDRVTGRVYQEIGMDPVRQAISGYNVEEFGCGFARFQNGMTMDVVEAWAAHLNGFEGSCILGSEAGIRLNPLSLHATRHDVQTDTTFDLKAMQYREGTVYADQSLHMESSQKHWVSALRGEIPLLDTAGIALNTALLQAGVFLSGQMGREVTADEVRALSKAASRDIPNLT